MQMRYYQANKTQAKIKKKLTDVLTQALTRKLTIAQTQLHQMFMIKANRGSDLDNYLDKSRNKMIKHS